MNRFRILKIRLIKLCMAFIHVVFKQTWNKVVFVSFSGVSYSDNPKAVSMAFARIFPDIQQVWIFENPAGKQSIVPKQVMLRKKSHLLFELATSSAWVFNDTLPAWVYKGKKQFYVQTWHGDRGFKKILYDYSSRKGKLPLVEESLCDLAVAGSDFGEAFFRTAFRYRGEVLKTGCPRNDVLVSCDNNLVSITKNHLGLEEKVRYVLYAPTLRRKTGKDRERQPVQTIDFMSTLNTLMAIFGGDWKFLVRSHVKVPGLHGVPESERIIDVSSVDDMAELLLVSDILITDYSSSTGDFALTHRPVILFQDDQDTYRTKERTFYFNISESPFWVVTTQEELISLIESLPGLDYSANCDAILQFYGTKETGHASEDVAMRVYGFCEKVHDG